MKIEDRLIIIDEFFDAITIEEFEKIAINAGAEDLYNTGGKNDETNKTTGNRRTQKNVELDCG